MKYLALFVELFLNFVIKLIELKTSKKSTVETLGGEDAKKAVNDSITDQLNS